MSNAGTMDIDIEKLIEECVFTAARSSGSGGQNVNKVSSKVLLSFDVNASDTLDEDQKRLILEKLSNRVNKNGVFADQQRIGTYPVDEQEGCDNPVQPTYPAGTDSEKKKGCHQTYFCLHSKTIGREETEIGQKTASLPEL